MAYMVGEMRARWSEERSLSRQRSRLGPLPEQDVVGSRQSDEGGMSRYVTGQVPDRGVEVEQQRPARPIADHALNVLG